MKNANPNGDPLNGNRPRTDYDGFGEVSDVCLKRKIRDRMQDAGHPVFVQSDEKKTDGMPSLKARAESSEHGLGKDAFNSKKISPEQSRKMACAKWLDVRSFGQLFAFKSEERDGVSIPHSWTGVDSACIQRRTGQHHQYADHEKRQWRRRRQ